MLGLLHILGAGREIAGGHPHLGGGVQVLGHARQVQAVVEVHRHHPAGRLEQRALGKHGPHIPAHHPRRHRVLQLGHAPQPQPPLSGLVADRRHRQAPARDPVEEGVQARHQLERRQVAGLHVPADRAEPEVAPELLGGEPAQHQHAVPVADQLRIYVGILAQDHRQQQALPRVGGPHDHTVHVHHQQAQQALAGPAGLRLPGRGPLLAAPGGPPAPAPGSAQQRHQLGHAHDQQHRAERDASRPGDVEPQRRQGVGDHCGGVHRHRPVPVEEAPNGRGSVDLGRQLHHLVLDLPLRPEGRRGGDEGLVGVEQRQRELEAQRVLRGAGLRDQILQRPAEGLALEDRGERVVAEGAQRRGRVDTGLEAVGRLTERAGLLQDHAGEDHIGACELLEDLGQLRGRLEPLDRPDLHTPVGPEQGALHRPSGGPRIVEAQPSGQFGDTGHGHGVGVEHHRHRARAGILHLHVHAGVDPARRNQQRQPQGQHDRPHHRDHAPAVPALSGHGPGPPARSQLPPEGKPRSGPRRRSAPVRAREARIPRWRGTRSPSCPLRAGRPPRRR